MLKTALIGVGGIANTYRRSLSNLGQSIVAVVDSNLRDATRVGQEEEAEIFHDYRKMLAEVGPDVVIACLPPGDHTTQVKEATEFGCAVFVSRPVALNPGVAVNTRDAIATANIINQVGYVGRYSDGIAKAKQLLAGRKITMANCRLAFRMNAGHPWWGDGNRSGGQLVEQTTHIFDTLRYLLGEVAQMQAWGVNNVSATGIADFEECVTCNMRFTSGAIASVSSTCVASADEGMVIELIADDACLRITNDLVVSGIIAGKPVIYQGIERGYFRQMKSFYEAVDKHKQDMVLCDYADGVKTLAVTLAANVAMRHNQVVQVTKQDEQQVSAVA
jgi:predicted dehydrogenase